MGMPGMGGGGPGTMPPGGPLTAILGGGNTPYSHGYGMGAPGDFQGYQSGPGLQDPQGYSAQGGDLTQRGIGENFFGGTAGGYTAPSMGEGYAATQLNKYAPGTPQGSALQAQNFAKFSANRPDFNAEPGLGKYYDRAVDRATTDVNNQLAARGMYGSSGGVGKLEDAVTDLRADQAKNEANYRLQQLGEQRGWEGLAGGLAGGADQNSLAGANNQLNWLRGLGDLGLSASNFGLGRVQAGQNAANGAQGLERNRFQSLLDNEMGMGNQMNQLMGGAYGDILGTDQDLMNSAMGMGMGNASEALNQDYRTQAQNMDNVKTAASLAGGMMGGL